MTSLELALAMSVGSGVVLLAGCGGGGGEHAGDGDVAIIRGAPEQSDWLDLTIDGVGLDAAAGTVVTIQIGLPDSPSERLGLARVELDEGSFHVEFPEVCEPGLYKSKVVFFDRAGDGVCSEEDLVVANSSASDTDRVVRVSAPLEDPAVFGEFYREGCEAVVSDWPSQ